MCFYVKFVFLNETKVITSDTDNVQDSGNLNRSDYVEISVFRYNLFLV